MLVEDFAPDDLVYPRLLDLQFTQLVGNLDRIASGAKEGRGALQQMITCEQSFAIAGINVAAVAPEPITIRRLPA